MVLPHLFTPFLLFLLTFQTSTHGVVLSHSPLPAVAAAGPILQDRPFVVVWNMPTARCQKRYNIHLNLGDFDILENRKQRFQGQNMTIFYRDRLGKYPYLSRDGVKMNGGIPQLGDLSAHLSLALTQMSSLLQPNFTGLAVIDWEEWRPLWERNFGTKMEYRRLSKLLVKQARPDLSNKAMTSLARQKFEESARKFMEETLRSAVMDRPRGLWGFYGFPACFNKHKRKTDKSYTGRCHGGTKKQNDQLSWLWWQSTALYPSVYLPQRLAGSMDAALMVRHRLLEALRVASVWHNTKHATPVLPYARLAFTHSLTFLNKTDLVHTLGESAALGAAGVVLWGELKFAKSKEQCILLRDYIHTVLGPFVQSLRSDTQRCSLQLCQGNGRCARRRPSSGHMLSSVPVMTSDPNEINLLPDASRGKSFHNHFMCLCYPGWTGQECQEKKKKENI
ncbi:hyaluronidase-3-like isoform X1 [Dicentrarchus labrax]|uniref:Hyaluronidase n=2 Tax=Dicentrarchus labrax TaxID=13489 RepID=A0A8C4IP96_DICLA|nr:hyaluronidase-3-like isoform X1 [Dicentrarchus labrax]XP_051280456.1 hyaluronidase-3-like isoform X1 [Dicentrarchus labrax]